jgi:septal ring factor EnvC (AmiA/AmiB activator)
MRRALAILICVALAATAAGAQPADREGARLDRQIEALRRELIALAAAEQTGQGDAWGQRARLEALNAREAAVKGRIERNRGQLARLLGALQMHQRNPPPPLLVNPRSARDAVRAAILIRAVKPELEARGRAFAAEATALAQVRRGAAVASEALFLAESDLADRRAEMERLISEKRALEGRLYPGEAAAQTQVRALAARAGSVGELVDELAEATAPSGGAPARFAPPVPGPSMRRSEGWVWTTAPGATVLAPAVGHVDYAGPLKGWGQVVILRIGGGYRLVLAGLENADVGVGRTVASGEPIGRMRPAGDSRAAPPELYLEVRNRTNPVDPARWLTATAR